VKWLIIATSQLLAGGLIRWSTASSSMSAMCVGLPTAAAAAGSSRSPAAVPAAAAAAHDTNARAATAAELTLLAVWRCQHQQRWKLLAASMSWLAADC
jgi:hypothetical protein